MNWVCKAVFILCCFKFLHSTHFRGGIITWTPVHESPTHVLVNATIKLGWRRSYSRACFCDQNDIRTGTKIIGETGLRATGGQVRGLFLGVYCTDFSLNEDWSYGEIEVTIEYQYPFAGVWYVDYTGAAWIPLINGGSMWSLSARVDLRTQKHTNRINRSPITSMSPLLRAKAGCYQEIRVPIEDPDGDFVRCRWARAAECGDSCQIPRNAELDEQGCLVKFNLTSDIGYYALRIQIEDFPALDSLMPLSSVPLQFLVQAYESASGSCSSTDKPVFNLSTKPDQACVGVPSEGTYQEMILVSGVNNSQITEIQTVSPTGMIKSELMAIDNSSSKYVNLTWSPTTTGVSLLCFLAVADSSVTSDQRCISLSVGFDAPKPIVDSMRPIGEVLANQTEWQIHADKNLTRPKFPSFIRFVENTTEKTVYMQNAMDSGNVFISGSLLLFRTKQFLKPNERYFILFDYGVLTSIESCNVNSEQITSRQFWAFDVKPSGDSTTTEDDVVTSETTSLLIEFSSSGNERSSSGGLALAIALPTIFLFLFLIALIVFLACWHKKKKKKNKTIPEDASSNDNFTTALAV